MSNNSQHSNSEKHLTRRQFIKFVLSAGAGFMLVPYWALLYDADLSFASDLTHPLIKKPIIKTGEEIPVIGLGTAITFSVYNDMDKRNVRTEILKNFFELGGGMIDSSPMYGSSEDVIGYGLRRLENTKGLFSATKVWTRFGGTGVEQVENSKKLWGLNQFDLIQVHNLVDWVEHLKTLKRLKEEGVIRYIGITTSNGRRHQELEEIMLTQEIDFVQLSYNILDRQVEDRLLPLALDKGIGVIANRPYRRGELMDYYEKKPLPEWAAEADCADWPQFLLKFVVSHPAVTCAIPATSRIDHLKENMAAGRGRLPNAKIRKRMIEYVERI